MATVQVRYIVDDVDAAIAFYTRLLGLKVEMHPAPNLAELSRADLHLNLSKPGGGKQILLEDPSGNLVELFERLPGR